MDLKLAVEAVASLDLSAENAEIEALATKRADILAGIARAQERTDAINAKLRAAMPPSGREVAAALVADEELPIENTRVLEEEGAAVRAGWQELRRQLEAIDGEEKAVRARASRMARDALAPFSEQLAQDAREGAEAVRRAHAGLQAIRFAINSHPVGGAEVAAVYDGIANAIGPAAVRLIPVKLQAEVPEALVSALNDLRDKGSALPGYRIGTSINL